MATIFFSYSHKDEGLRDKLETHLAMLRREGLIEAWHDRRIAPGDVIDRAIDTYLERADIILLLVSADFFASDYCYDLEMQRAMERHARGEATVIPVILRPCDWNSAPFGSLLAVPRDGKAVTLWANPDEAFVDVVSSIRMELARRQKGDEPGRRPSLAAGGTQKTTGLRSSNLRITRTFTDHEKDEFLDSSFDEMATFFENSLAELVRRNTSVEARFKRLDAHRFTAAAYVGGRTVARCTIWLGAEFGSKGIAYVANDSGATGGFNESFSVEADEQMLYLKPLGMAAAGQRRRNERLSIQGAAEYLWDLFIEPLQRSH